MPRPQRAPHPQPRHRLAVGDSERGLGLQHGAAATLRPARLAQLQRPNGLSNGEEHRLPVALQADVEAQCVAVGLRDQRVAIDPIELYEHGIVDVVEVAARPRDAAEDHA